MAGNRAPSLNCLHQPVPAPPPRVIGFQAGSATDSVSKVVQTSSVIGIRTLAEHESAWKTDARQGYQ